MARFTALAVAIVAVVVSGCDLGAVDGESTRPPIGAPAETLPGSIETTATVPSNGDPGTVVSVLDGDSIEVDLDGDVLEVRLIGINTPESWECHGSEAKAFTASLLEDADVVLLRAGEDERDQFGRYLRFVFLLDGTFVNRAIVREGHALALSGEHERERDLRDAEDEAFAEGLGLWAIGACGEQGSTTVRIVDVEYNPPGRDSENPNGEWVAIENTGGEPQDIGSWVLRDESSQHRYEFPGGFALVPGQVVRVLSGCGEDQSETLHWCAGDPLWSNGGDTALLLDGSGNVVSRLNYPGDF